jgi:FMN phosphatase YigB (HAD superfamily)
MTKQFNPKDKVLILDFDHTCYDTNDFLVFEMKQPMLRHFNITADIWERSYCIAADIGYSPVQQLKEIFKITKSTPFTISDIKTFEKSINFSKYLYFDCESFLKKAKSRGYKTMILSYGAVDWQKKKIQGAGLDKMVDIVKYIVTSGSKAKMKVIRQYAGNCSRVIFVDNKGTYLDTVHEVLPKVETYLMNRKPSNKMNKNCNDQTHDCLESRRKVGMKTHYSHKQCQTFKEITL